MKFVKYGRFAFVIPYIIVPFFLMFGFGYDFASATVLALFMPFGIGFTLFAIYPVCWLISIACCVVDAKMRSEFGERIRTINTRTLVFIGMWIVVYLASVVFFVSNFSLSI